VVLASMGGGFAVRQLTTTGTNDHACVHDGFVVWVHFTVEDGDEIYIANLDSPSPMLTRLTENGGEKEHPSNHGAERIVWEGRGSSSEDWEIWLYDKLAIPRYAQFTDNTLPDRFADLAGGGDFAWLQGNTMYESVHYWNENLHSESVISGSCCPTTQWSNEIPSADDNAVVWRSYDRTHSESPRVWLWNGTLTEITDEIEGHMTVDHSLNAGGIAYEYGSSPTLIKYWDGATVHDVGPGFSPCLYAGTVVYEIWDGHDWEIRYWDGSTTLNITDNDFDDGDPSLYGTIIAWTGRLQGVGNHIFYVDLAE
jgi:hypothetical protein